MKKLLCLGILVGIATSSSAMDEPDSKKLKISSSPTVVPQPLAMQLPFSLTNSDNDNDIFESIVKDKNGECVGDWLPQEVSIPIGCQISSQAGLWKFLYRVISLPVQYNPMGVRDQYDRSLLLPDNRLVTFLPDTTIDVYGVKNVNDKKNWACLKHIGGYFSDGCAEARIWLNNTANKVAIAYTVIDWYQDPDEEDVDETIEKNLALLNMDDYTYSELIHDTKVESALFNEAGDRLLTITEDNRIHMWDATTEAKLFSMPGTRAQFSKQNNRVVILSADHTAQVFDATTGAELFNVPGQACVSEGPSDVITTVSADQKATVYQIDGARAELKATLGVYSGIIRFVEFDEVGRRAFTISEENNAQLWDIESGKCLAFIQEIDRVVFSPSKDTFVTASTEGAVKLWNCTTGIYLGTLAENCELAPEHEVPKPLTFSPSGRYFAITRYVDRNPRTRIYDTRTGAPMIYHFNDNQTGIVHFDSSEHFIVTTCIEYCGFLVYEIKEVLEAANFIQRNLTLNQAVLLQGIKECIKLRKVSSEKIDLTKLPQRLKDAYNNLPEIIKNVLNPYVIQVPQVQAFGEDKCG